MSFTRPKLIGIAGLSGSGKTTVADKIAEKYGKDCLILNADRYYVNLPYQTVEERAAPSKDVPAAIDFALLVDHVRQLANGEKIEAPRYCFKTHKRLPETDTFDPNGIKFIVVESILVFCNTELLKLFTKKIYVDTPMDICLLRRVIRDINEREREINGIAHQYIETVRPAIINYIGPSQQHADLVITNSETVKNSKDAPINMQAVFDLIDPPVVTIKGTPSNSGVFAGSVTNFQTQNNRQALVPEGNTCTAARSPQMNR